MRWRRFLLFGVTFWFIFGFRIGTYLDLVTLVSLALIGWYALSGPRQHPVEIRRVLLALYVLAVYAGIVVVLNGGWDVQVAARSLRALINFGGAVALIELYRTVAGERYVSTILVDVFACLVCHGLLMMAMFMNPGLRLAVYELADTYAEVNLNAPLLLGYRITGLTYGLAQTSVLQGYGLLLLPVVLRDAGPARRALVFPGAAVLVLSMLISGRTGILLVGIVAPVVIVLAIRSRSRSGSSLRRWVPRLVTMSLGLYAASAVFSWVGASAPANFEKYTVERAQEFMQDLTAGRLGSLAEEAGSVRYFLPDSGLEAAFGSSNLGRADEFRYIESDAGYVRLLFATGIVGLVLVLVPYVIGIRAALRRWRQRDVLGAVALGVLIAGLLLNTKELALLTRNQWSVQAILIVLCAQPGLGARRKETVERVREPVGVG